MKLRTNLVAVLCVVLFCGFFAVCSSADVLAASDKDPVLTVLNPLGTAPPINLLPMAPRLDTLKGKTIYIVNDGYPGSNLLLGELKAVLEEKYPDTTFVYKEKGGMGSKPPQLWKEMEEKADAMIIALGH